MLFNSIDFAVFLPVVFTVYWFFVNKNIRLQNLFLILASYVFYGWWDYRFLSLIIFSSLVDYLVGRGLSVQTINWKRKLLLALSIVVNLGFLGFFKYYNFFAENFAQAFTFFGYAFEINRLQIILPVGISFYTFQTLSYSIDVYRKKLEPTRDMISFFAFVSFFPQLVAGPIERATNLLPQFFQARRFEKDAAIDGLRQILWGLFKKIVIADNCAYYANEIFNHSNQYSGSTLVLGAFFFAFQIYGDFSGYSDIAIGTGRLFGFNLMKNFAFPYFSRDIAEFWRRWHISLSSWFRDYLYIPLGGSRGGIGMQIRNTMIIFIVSGFWHGANWTFIVWGTLNAIYFLPLMLMKRNRKNLDIIAEGKLIPSFRETTGMVVTFILTLFAWIFFRAENIGHAFNYIRDIFSNDLFAIPSLLSVKMIIVLCLVIAFIAFEWTNREKDFALQMTSIHLIRPLRWAIYMGIASLIIWFGGSTQDFIYFQF